MNLLKSYEKRAFKLRSLLIDSRNLKMTEACVAKATQLDPAVALVTDRRREFAEYYKLSEDEAAAVESIRNKQVLEDHFNTVETDDGLLNNYRDASYLYMARLMMAYSRFPAAWKILQYLNSRFTPGQRNRIKVLDYGCGAADYGLAFAVNGYAVTLCDIEGGNLDFAQWRFQRRGLPVNVIAANQDELYPALTSQKVVLSGELFEHIREPFQVLQNITQCLQKGGYFWHSGYPEVEREVGGDHLIEAAEQRLETLHYLRSHFKTATRIQLPGYLYRKL